MCHYVDTAVNWDEVVLEESEREPLEPGETEGPDFDTAVAAEPDESEARGEETTPKATPPADD